MKKWDDPYKLHSEAEATLENDIVAKERRSPRERVSQQLENFAWIFRDLRGGLKDGAGDRRHKEDVADLESKITGEATNFDVAE